VLDDVLRRQCGILSHRQAVTAGLSRGAIRAHLAAGRWQRIHARVYATFSGPLSRSAALWAVALRAGPGSALSHHTAAELAGLIDDPSAPIHVTVPPGRQMAPLRGVRIHRSTTIAGRAHPARLPPQTRVEETVLDLGDLAACPDDAVAWVAAACGRRLTTPQRIADAASTRRRLRWRAALARACAAADAGCHSVLELRYLRDVERAHGLPAGARQHRHHGGYDDVRYAEYGLVVELDGGRYHREEARLRDRRRDNARTAAGCSILRYDWLAVTGRPCAVAAEVSAALRVRGWAAAGRPCGSTCTSGL
jgi:very-short-patch-repair endonuclease